MFSICNISWLLDLSRISPPTDMIGHIADAVRVIGLLLPGHEDPDGVGGDAGDAVGGHQHDAGAEHHAAAEELQPG